MFKVELPQPIPAKLALRGLAAGIEWPTVSQDLIALATAVLMADRLCPRPRGTLGARRINLNIPVRSPALWREAAPQIQEILKILGGDTFDFAFSRSKEGCLPFPLPASPQSIRADYVALFSGGLDSAAGAAILTRRGDRIAYVTHYTKGIAHISRLLSEIYEAYGGAGDPMHAMFHIRPVGPLVQRMREHSRRSRSFLYLSLALATAVAVNASEVLICENGVLALNLPLSPAMVPTRHASSELLHSMERLAQVLYGRSIRFRNPFELETKGQMSRVFQHHPEIALETVSCWNQQWAGRNSSYSKGHCGLCLPCLVRRASLEAAGIQIPRNHFDVNAKALLVKSRLDTATDSKLGTGRLLLNFASRIQRCHNWNQFLEQFPDVIGHQPTMQPMQEREWFEKIYRMMKRFVREIYLTFKVQ